MKLFFVILISIFILNSCSTSKINTSLPKATALSLSPVLIRDITLMNRCEVPFWLSNFGRYVSEKQNSKNINLTVFFKALDSRPKACSMPQSLRSINSIGSAGLALRNQKKINEDDFELTQRLRTIQQTLIKTDLTVIELITGLVLFNDAEEQYGSRVKLTPLIAEIKKELISHQDTILIRTINHES